MGCVKSKPLSSSLPASGGGVETCKEEEEGEKTTIFEEDESQEDDRSQQLDHHTDDITKSEDVEEEEVDCQRSSILADIMGSIHNNSTFDLENKCVHVVTADIATIESIYDGVRDGPILGYGITGVVRKAVHRDTGAEYAIKTLSLDRIETVEGLEQLKEELGILMQLDHPNIVKLEEIYESENEIFLVQELLSGGDLFDRLDAQPMEHYSEGQCAKLVKQMLSAVRYIHSKGIIHRDLKLENFLFDDPGPDGELKMIDFGLSKHFKAGSKHHEPVGTRYTVAPEVLRKHYDEKADVSVTYIYIHIMNCTYAIHLIVSNLTSNRSYITRYGLLVSLHFFCYLETLPLEVAMKTMNRRL
jgi:tRNA A-37 threonylcarbamoyl transferase component Bud32